VPSEPRSAISLSIAVPEGHNQEPKFRKCLQSVEKRLLYSELLMRQLSEQLRLKECRESALNLSQAMQEPPFTRPIPGTVRQTLDPTSGQANGTSSVYLMAQIHVAWLMMAESVVDIAARR